MPLPCQQHHPPRSLKNKYIIKHHNILPHPPTAPVHPPNLHIPPLPPPPNIMLKDPRQFAIHKILDHKRKQFKDHNGINRTIMSYLCQWTTTDNTTDITNGELKGTYTPTVKPTHVITTHIYLSITTPKDNANIFQTSLMPTSPQNNIETQDTSHQPQ